MDSNVRLAALVTLMLGSGMARADRAKAAPEGPPIDAPPACIDPVGATGLPLAITRGPSAARTHRLVVGKPMVVGNLRLRAAARFIPERVGSSAGEWLPGLEAQLVAEAKRDGVAFRNTVEQSGYDPIRIGTLRVSVIKVSNKRKRTTLEVLVEDLGCRDQYVHPPLAAGASKTFWVSTEATPTYYFSTGHWYDQVPAMYFMVSSGLDPDVQQEPGTRTPHGWINSQAWEREGGLPSSESKYLKTLTAGAVFDLPIHRVEVLRVEVGKDTSVVDGRVHTVGRLPVVSALVKVTRKTTPSTVAPSHKQGPL